jgi:hypothetical protein
MRLFVVNSALVVSLYLTKHNHVVPLEHVHANNVSWLPVVDVGGHTDLETMGVIPLKNHGPTAVAGHSALLEMTVQHTHNLVPDEYHADLIKHHDAFMQKWSSNGEGQGKHKSKVRYTVVEDNLPSELKKNTSMFHILEQEPLGVVTTRNIANSQFMGWITVGTPPVPIQVVFDTGSTNAWLTSAHCDSGACPHIHDKYDAAGSKTSNPTNYQPNPALSADKDALIEKQRVEELADLEEEQKRMKEEEKQPLFKLPDLPPRAESHHHPRHPQQSSYAEQMKELGIPPLLPPPKPPAGFNFEFKIPKAYEERAGASFIETSGDVGNAAPDDSLIQAQSESGAEAEAEMESESEDAAFFQTVDLFHFKKDVSEGGFQQGVVKGQPYPDLFKSYYLHIRFGTGEIMGWTQKDTIRFGPVEVKDQVFGQIYEEKGNIFMALSTFGGILGCGLPSMSAQGARPVMDSAMAQGIPGLFAFYMDKRTDSPSAFMIGGVLRDTLASNLHLVEVFQPHYWSMRLLDMKIGDESLNLGDVKAIVVDSGTSSLTAPRSMLGTILEMLKGRDCSEIKDMPLVKFTVAVNGARPEEDQIPWDIEFTPQQYMLHSSGNPNRCSPAWWNIDVPPPYGPAFLLGELFLKHYMAVFYREHGDSPAVVGIAKAANPPASFSQGLCNGANPSDRGAWPVCENSGESSFVQVDNKGQGTKIQNGMKGSTEDVHKADGESKKTASHDQQPLLEFARRASGRIY